MEAHTDPTALPDLSPAALLDLLGEWELALRAEDKTPGTIEAYVGGTRRYLDWCRLANTTPMLRASLQTWMTHLLQDGNAPGTVLARKQSVKRYSDWLLATGRIPRPALPRRQRTRPTAPHRAAAVRGPTPGR